MRGLSSHLHTIERAKVPTYPRRGDPPAGFSDKLHKEVRTEHLAWCLWGITPQVEPPFHLPLTGSTNPPRGEIDGPGTKRLLPLGFAFPALWRCFG